MLQLQRASAGSGKTYTLAKKFIEYYISSPDGAGKRRLVPIKYLRESLRHILAITFTNKATNEMKLRIVDKLNALGAWQPGTPTGEVDYMDEFIKEFSCSPTELSKVCKEALKVLLTDYGDFKVSTIDSFFQTVLRTFAYEADLDDTYQLELDSNFVSQMGLDTTLDEIETGESASQGATWISSLMEGKAAKGKGWNIFQKKATGYSVYSEILNASRNLAKEDFKEIRESLDQYFEAHPDFFTTYHDLCRLYEKGPREAFDKMRKAARDVRDAFETAGLDMDATAGSYLASRVRNMAEKWDWDFPAMEKASFKIPEFTRKGATTRVFHPKKENPLFDTPTEDHIESLATVMYERFDEWRMEGASDKMKKWRIYRSTLPYVGILQSVRANARLFLTDTNTVELGETNSILSRIIGKDDAPFVYERLGNRLEHFLIDEFQDTSDLQWHNLRPLLTNSEGNGHDNLIIGDAKQSIYRFRNADPTLITETVPTEFAATCRQCGNTPAENTNWRSSLRVVRFNNLFFRFFSKELGDKMERLYSNTVQPPSHTDERGYVRVQLFEKPSDPDEAPAHFDEIPRLIADMLNRGYEMKEIAVLVDTHKQGAKVIERIMLYNLREDTERKINFVSVDSLMAGESPAVQTVISILEAINSGTSAQLNPEEQRKDNGAGIWSKLKADFSFFSMQHPDTPLSELLRRFLNGEYDPDAISEMLAEMSTTILPALVENIIRHFIPEHSRHSEAPFIAALQDMVLEFCEGHSADIASFLTWWDKKGRFRSISSPEDADAVNIMTVHKSKGLEFRCVIVPYSDQTIAPASQQKKEWLWVEPDLSEAEGLPQIPWIPVWSTPELEGTIHADTYRKYLDNFMTDKVNMAYVAYTRAIDELYIYTPGKIQEDGTVKNGQHISAFLWRCGIEANDIITDIKDSYPDCSHHIPGASDIETDTDNQTWSYGQRLTKMEILAGRKKKSEGPENHIVSDYRCGHVIPALLYADPTTPDSEILADEQQEEPDDPESEESRRYGLVMHSVMEHVETSSDLTRALLKAKSAGLINATEMELYKTDLSAALESVKGYGWFDDGHRVINERGIVCEGKVRRPDRMMIRPDGTAVIIDYKFGEHRNDKAYLRQVKRYTQALIASGLAKKCEAYIWYVSLGKVVSLPTP